eukprot:JP436312.1.p1 GENE.JP436312.1~~JP436312.1.p1  ORF type:complete len:261 (-),score=46.58 JP436312.1:89-871(-)
MGSEKPSQSDPDTHPQVVQDANVDFQMQQSESMKLTDVEQHIRMGFVRKVYCILAFQLVLTAGIIAPFVVVQEVNMFVRANPGFFYGALAASIAALIVLLCCGNMARKYPMNYVMLLTFTVFEAVLLGCISSNFKTTSVLIAFGMTVGITAGLTLFAWQTKIDFTQFSASLFCVLWTLLLFGFLFGVGYGRRGFGINVVYASVGVLIFSLYIVYDTQLIIGGRHKKYQFTVDDYVFGALSLYLDVVNLFILLLACFGGRR